MRCPLPDYRTTATTTTNSIDIKVRHINWMQRSSIFFNLVCFASIFFREGTVSKYRYNWCASFAFIFPLFPLKYVGYSRKNPSRKGQGWADWWRIVGLKTLYMVLPYSVIFRPLSGCLLAAVVPIQLSKGLHWLNWESVSGQIQRWLPYFNAFSYTPKYSWPLKESES